MRRDASLDKIHPTPSDFALFFCRQSDSFKATSQGKKTKQNLRNREQSQNELSP